LWFCSWSIALSRGPEAGASAAKGRGIHQKHLQVLHQLYGMQLLVTPALRLSCLPHRRLRGMSKASDIEEKGFNY